MEIKSSSVTDLYHETLWWAKIAEHEIENSRVGRVKTFQDPLTIINTQPDRRVLIDDVRNANPFFHLMECIWMFSGANDDWIVRFNKQMTQYMDYGQFHGAYGWRWMNHWKIDQVKEVINMLRNTSSTRRAYLSIWDPDADLNIEYKDLPCNVGMAFQKRGGKLNGYVFNRSNDLIWGMLGTNCVHFSMLLELVATCANLEMGSLYQHTINPHIYERHWPLLESPHSGLVEVLGYPPPRRLAPVDYSSWVRDSKLFTVLNWTGRYENAWFNAVAAPIYRAYIDKDKTALDDIEAPDWAMAAKFWWDKNRDWATAAKIWWDNNGGVS